MTSEQLAEKVSEIVKEAQTRVLGIGREQYEEGGTQKFETMPLPRLLDYFEEELLDQINYSVMNIIRLRRFREALHHAATMAELRGHEAARTIVDAEMRGTKHD